MLPYPAIPVWLGAVGIAAAGVWAAQQYSQQAGWWLAVLTLISVLVLRQERLRAVNDFIATVLGKAPSNP